MRKCLALSGSVLSAFALALFTLTELSGFQQAPRGLVQNIRSSVTSAGAVEVLYDLIAEDPRAPFTAAVEVSLDEGRTFQPIAGGLTGDAGAGVVAGIGKRIVWQPGAEFRQRDLSKATFRVILGAAAAAGPARGGARTGSVVVATVPSGASVFLNGTLKGETPLTLTDLTAGRYQIKVTREGYLENQRDVSVNAGDPQTVTISLTATGSAPVVSSSGAATQPTASAGGGGSALKWVLPVAGGGAGAAYLLTRKKGTDPVITGGGGGGGGGGSVSCSTVGASPATLTAFAAGGGSQTVSVSVGPSGCVGGVNWSSTNPVSWITISPSSGSSSASVTVTAAVNTGLGRSGAITVAGQAVAVSQSAAPNPCTYTVRLRQGANNQDLVGSGAGQREVEVTTNIQTCAWTAISDVPWITANPTSGTGNRTGSQAIVLTIAQNATRAPRTGRVTIAGTVITLIQNP